MVIFNYVTTVPRGDEVYGRAKTFMVAASLILGFMYLFFWQGSRSILRKQQITVDRTTMICGPHYLGTCIKSVNACIWRGERGTIFQNTISLSSYGVELFYKMSMAIYHGC